MLPAISLLLLTMLGGSLASFAAGRYARWAALAASFLAFLEVTAMLGSYSWPGFAAGGVPGFAHAETYAWISVPWLQIHYAVGLDGISLPLLLLTVLLQLVTVVYSFDESRKPAAWFGLLMLTCLGCAGVFVSLDVLLFFLFWELVLIPMFFLIGYWGGAQRRYAALKFFVYTHVGSIVMLVALLAAVFYSGSSSLDFAAMYGATRTLAATAQVFLFLAMLFGFGIKFPLVPFHTWLPDAHVEAPTGGSVLLAGLLLKLGGYGLIRWGLELLPNGLLHLQPLLYAAAFVSIVWGSVIALAQRDLKRLVAYSSINHMGIVLLAIAVYSSLGVLAAVLLMFAHGVVSALLFMVSGSVHHSFGSRDIATIQGITPRAPVLSTYLMAGSLASLGLPALISFPAEFTAFLAAWNRIGYWVLIPLAVLVVTAAFYLWMMQRLLFGPTSGVRPEAKDPAWPQTIAMGLLVGLAVLYGILPGLLTNVITQSPIVGLP